MITPARDKFKLTTTSIYTELMIKHVSIVHRGLTLAE